jgi:ketosteroid isomerase-like protein
MDNRQIIQAYFDRMNSEDWEGLGDLFAEDAVLEAPGFPRQRGRETVSGYFRAALGIYPKHYDDPVRIVVAGDTVTVNIHYEGTLANGYQLSFDAVDVFELRDGKIVEETSWYDSHMVRQALLEARALDQGSEGDRARLRLAMAGVRGDAHVLGGEWSDTGPNDALCVPAVIVDGGGELTAERIAALPKGFALLVRDATAIDPAALSERSVGGSANGAVAPGGGPWATGLALADVRAEQGVLVGPAAANGGRADLLLIA